MPSSFFGLNLAASGLQAQQAALNVIGHNIANANNPNYRRQQAVITARSPYPYPSANAGTGVAQLGAGADVTSIRRMQDDFVEGQLLGSTQTMGQFEAGKKGLDQIMSIIGEPSDTGLNSSLNKFWGAWQDLSVNPNNSGARNSVLQYGQAVAQNLNRLSSQMRAVQDQQDGQIRSDVDTVNQLAKQLASVNDLIQRSVGAGQTPNDLLDQRADLLGQLSNLADVQVYGNGGASDVISIGGHALVQGNQAMSLTAVNDASGHATVQWANDSSPAQIKGGELGGILDVQKNVIPGYLASLDSVASALITRVNQLHSAGYGLDGTTGRAFFTGTNAASIGVNQALIDNPNLVAASASGAPGDPSQALAIAKVKDELLVGGTTINGAYTALVSRNGADASNADTRLEAQTKIHQQLTAQQQSVSGVSLDEEMADMVRFQQAYNASARVVNVMNDMLSTLIDRLGVG